MATNIKVTDEIDISGTSLKLSTHNAPTGLTEPASTAMLAVASSGITVDTGTKTATAVAGAATLAKVVGKVTSEALTTAALAAYTLTLTNSRVSATSQVFASVANGTNSQGIPLVGRITPAAGTAVILIENQHATLAFNGTVVISFLVVN